MAKGGDDFVEQLTTPVSAMHIRPPAPLQSRVKREATSPTGHTQMAKKEESKDTVQLSEAADIHF